MGPEKCKCGSTHFQYVEYAFTMPEHYDGISELHCMDCKTRYGRWSNKELKTGELEQPYGREKRNGNE